jgi:hypothetical protein
VFVSVRTCWANATDLAKRENGKSWMGIEEHDSRHTSAVKDEGPLSEGIWQGSRGHLEPDGYTLGEVHETARKRSEKK